MTLLERFDYGWLYLICGLVITVSAIVLPAYQNLQVLESKRLAIKNNLLALEYRVQVYEEFLIDVQEDNPAIQSRIQEMQFNLKSSGTPVVTDISAPSTPLEWISERSQRTVNVPMRVEESSILSSLSKGRSRLILFGAGVFFIFIGLVKDLVKK